MIVGVDLNSDKEIWGKNMNDVFYKSKKCKGNLTDHIVEGRRRSWL